MAVAAAAWLTACSAPKADVPRESIAIMSALPLFWGEARASAVLSSPDQRAPFILAMQQAHRVRPVDVLDKAAFAGTDVLILAQPRILQAQELVDLDAWVRNGGHVLIFADPELAWPSAFPLGDPRRAPPVTLLDPLFTHWGLTLSADGEAGPVDLDGEPLTPNKAGRWTAHGPACATEGHGLIVTCAIGKGKAVLVADADLLDLRETPDRASGLLILVARASR